MATSSLKAGSECMIVHPTWSSGIVEKTRIPPFLDPFSVPQWVLSIGYGVQTGTTRIKGTPPAPIPEPSGPVWKARAHTGELVNHDRPPRWLDLPQCLGGLVAFWFHRIL